MFKKWREREFLNRYKQLEDTLNMVRESVSNQFVRDTLLMGGFTKQSQILQNNNRKVIAIFVTEAVLQMLLRKIVIDKDSRDTVYATLITSGKPVGHLSGIPIYVSTLMTQAQLFIVGEIQWVLN